VQLLGVEQLLLQLVDASPEVDQVWVAILTSATGQNIVLWHAGTQSISWDEPEKAERTSAHHQARCDHPTPALPDIGEGKGIKELNL
jgi:hypothetical protein